MLVKNGKVISPFRERNCDIKIKNSLIVGVNPEINAEGDQIIDAEGCYVIPGLIDLHTHGAGGGSFINADKKDFETAGRMHLTHGVTTLLPTASAALDETLLNFIDGFDDFIKSNNNGGDYTQDLNLPYYPGLHLEGPYFADSQKGAQDERFIRKPVMSEYKRYIERHNNISRISFAPEVEGAMDLADYLREQGVISAVAHSDATMEDILESLEHGVELLTHFYSGMSMLVRKNAYRVPGIVEAGYLRDELMAEIISDGSHLPPQVLKLIYKILGPTRMCMISDSLHVAGLDISEYEENGRKFRVEDHVAKLYDRSAFAGSVTLGNDLLKVMVNSTNANLMEAVEMMSVNPAKILKMDDKLGRIATGYYADLVLLDMNLDVVKVIHRGKVVYSK